MKIIDLKEIEKIISVIENNTKKELTSQELLPGSEKENPCMNILEKIMECCEGKTLLEVLRSFSNETAESKYLKEKLRILDNTARSYGISYSKEELKKLIESKGEAEKEPEVFVYLCGCIIKNGFLKYSDFYKIVGYDSNTWYKFSRGTMPDKDRLRQIAVVLRMDFYEAVYLWNLAGETFQKNSQTDMIIGFLLQSGKLRSLGPVEALIMVNEVLESLGLPVLGEKGK